MALSRDKKTEVINDVKELLQSSKLTVVASYEGTPVKAMQDLRRYGWESGTQFKVVKNRLAKQAISSVDHLKDADTSSLEGMLLYAFNNEDEAAPAQTIATFAKKQKTLSFVGAFTADGEFMPAEDVKQLSELPSKEQLRGMVAGTIAAPLTGFVNVMSGNLRGLAYVLQARAESLNK